jgi:hypothetical protein
MAEEIDENEHTLDLMPSFLKKKYLIDGWVIIIVSLILMVIFWRFVRGGG